MTDSRQRIGLLSILLVALLLRLGVAVWWQYREGDRFVFGDSESYWSLARAIAQGNAYEYGSYDAKIFRTPGYPLLLTPLFVIFGTEPPVLAARILGAIWGTLGVWGVWWLGRNLFGPRAGTVAALLGAVYPEAVATSVLVLSEAAFCPLVVLNLVLLVAAWQEQRGRKAFVLEIWAGLVAGAATLVRPEWLLFTPFAILIGLLLCRDRKKQLALGSAAVLGLVVAMSPWWSRNAVVSGRFVPTTLQVGVSLYDGLNPAADGGSDMEFVDSFVAELQKQKPLNRHELFEYRLDRLAKSRALQWATEHPGRATWLMLVKLQRMWNVWPNEPGLSFWPIRLAVAALYIPVIILAFLGAMRTISWGWPYVLCWIPAVYLTLLHVVFVSSIRYRQPAIFGLIVLAVGILAIWGNWGIAAIRVGKLDMKR